MDVFIFPWSVYIVASTNILLTPLQDSRWSFRYYKQARFLGPTWHTRLSQAPTFLLPSNLSTPKSIGRGLGITQISGQVEYRRPSYVKSSPSSIRNIRCRSKPRPYQSKIISVCKLTVNLPRETGLKRSQQRPACLSSGPENLSYGVVSQTSRFNPC